MDVIIKIGNLVIPHQVYKFHQCASQFLSIYYFSLPQSLVRATKERDEAIALIVLQVSLQNSDRHSLNPFHISVNKNSLMYCAEDN